MINQAENMWNLFEKSGCIIYYLMYKMIITQYINAGNRSSSMLAP